LIDAEYRGQKEGDVITVLHDKKKREIVMSDSVMEKRTNLDFIEDANGDVLIAGLGLGMIVLAIQDKKDVDNITIVEIDNNLKNLVMQGLKEKLSDKVEIVICDINEFEPKKKYDSVYCDIWNNIDSDNWVEMKKLTRKFKKFVNRDNERAFLNHWRKKDVQRLSYE
jgi:spermidine synthase